MKDERDHLTEALLSTLDTITSLLHLSLAERTALADDGGLSVQALLEMAKAMDRMASTGSATAAALPVTVVMQPPTNGASPGMPPGLHPLPFDEFDELCRREMKRLSMDGRLPGRKLWDAERDKRLPTLDAVRMRYHAPTLADLAQELGLEPPLWGKLKRTEEPA